MDCWEAQACWRGGTVYFLWRQVHHGASPGPKLLRKNFTCWCWLNMGWPPGLIHALRSHWGWLPYKLTFCTVPSFWHLFTEYQTDNMVEHQNFFLSTDFSRFWKDWPVHEHRCRALTPNLVFSQCLPAVGPVLSWVLLKIQDKYSV